MAHNEAGEPDAAPFFTLPPGCSPGEAATVYFKAGFAPILLHSVKNGACSCKEGKACKKPGKHPDARRYPKDRPWTAAPTPDEVEAHWREHPNGNVGLQMGGAGRRITIDIDGKRGAESLAALERELGPLPRRTLTSRTGSGGKHIVLVVPEGLDLGAIKNTASIVAPGIDIRATGGQIVGAPSMHASGDPYVWTDVSPPAVLPDAWYERLVLSAAPKAEPSRVGQGGASTPSPASTARPRQTDESRADRRRAGWLASAIKEACDELAGAGEGRRNATLNAKAYTLGRLVGAGALTRGEVEAALTDAALACGLDKREIAPTLCSGLDDGAASPKPPPDFDDSDDTGLRQPRRPQGRAGALKAPPRGNDSADDQANDAPPPSASHDRRQGERRRPDVHRCTDTGNAERLVAHHGADLRYCHPWQKWLVWNGNRWRTDDQGGVKLRAKNTVRAIYQEAANVTAKKPGDESSESAAVATRKALAEWAKKSESAGARAAMVTLAQSEPSIPVLPEELDSDPWLFNVQNGTIDLRTGELRQHNASELITKLAPVVYDPAASCPTWLAFLDTAMAGDAELVSFLQRFVGYCLTGVIREHVLVSFYGTGSNGKSTFLETILAMFGPYGWQAPPDLLLQKQNDAHPTDMASLFGVRFATCIETASGRRLDEARMKQLTGGDQICARRMREDFWTFAPTHKLALGTNHKPVIGTTDHGTWRRQKLVPFTVTVPDGKQDKRLPEKLRAELSGILRWAIDGCLAWQAEGLGTPARVREATAGWRDESDPLGPFLSECCELGGKLETKARDLFTAYTAHGQGSGEEPVKQRTFGMRLTERGLTAGKSNGVRLWRGVRLLTPLEQRERAAGGRQGGVRVDPSAGSQGSEGSVSFRFNGSDDLSRETNREVSDPSDPSDPGDIDPTDEPTGPRRYRL